MKIWERWGPLTGVLSVICTVYGTLLVLGQPQDTDSNTMIVAYFASHAHRVQGIVGFFVFLAGITQLFGIFFFPFFVWWIWLAATAILLVVRPTTTRASLAIPAT